MVRVEAELRGPESDLVAMRKNWCTEEGYFASGSIENLPFTFLTDTGSNVTILSKGLK